jgi:hypothetical protein
MYFQDQGPPILAVPPVSSTDAPGAPQGGDGGQGGGGVAGGPVPLGTPYIFPVWVVL